MQTQQNRRSSYFIDKRFQSRYVGIGIMLILLIACFALLLMLYSNDKTKTSDPSMEIANSFFSVILPLLVVVVIVVFLTVIYGIRFSHRVAGPIYAFNRHLNWIKEGIYHRDLRLREKDEFKNLARVFNVTQSALRQRVEQTIDVCDKA